MCAPSLGVLSDPTASTGDATMLRGDACDRTARTSAFCIFLGRRGIAVRTLLWCDRHLSRHHCSNVRDKPGSIRLRGGGRVVRWCWVKF